MMCSCVLWLHCMCESLNIVISGIVIGDMDECVRPSIDVNNF